MSAALAEAIDAITTNKTGPSTARAEANRANGRLSRGRPRRKGGRAAVAMDARTGSPAPALSCRRTRRRTSSAARPNTTAPSGPAMWSNASSSARWRWGPGEARNLLSGSSGMMPG